MQLLNKCRLLHNTDADAADQMLCVITKLYPVVADTIKDGARTHM